MTRSGQEGQWTRTLQPERRWLDLRLGELWHYRHLVTIFIRRDLRASYKQTILGPAWIIIPPLISTVVFTIIFGKIAKLSADGSPHVLFYMSGIVVWGFFNACVVGNASTFTSQAGMFSKVYFPRLIVPIANTGSTLVATGIQLVFLCGFIVFYMSRDMVHGPTWAVILLPLLLLQSAALALGIGTMVSAITAKYRDLSFLLGYGIQLWMYATTIIYPLSSVPQEYQALALVNPMTSVVETFRFAVLGTGSIPVGGLLYSLLAAVIAFLIGLVVFNRVEQTAMDTI